jgi:hypothetical protein
MEDRTLASLRNALRICVGMLSRQLRYDLWRITEPQHGRAREAVVQAVMDTIDDGFEVTKKPAREPDSAAQLYRGPK